MSDHKKLLSCWHKLEHFSPAAAPQASEKNIVLLPENEQWKIPLKSSDPTKVIEYTVYLGVFDSSVANDFVKDYFKDIKTDENFRNTKICFASIKLNEKGKYINDSLGISTLPWALGQLEKGKIKNDNWNQSFETVKENLWEYLELNFKETITNEDNEIIKISTVVSNAQLLSLQAKVETLCEWSVKPTKEIYLKTTEKFRTVKETKATADILNSFYIKDLERIISQYDEKSVSNAFKQFLDGSLNKQTKRIDVTKDVDLLKDNLSPKNYPDGCWPSEYTLSLMQQFAVNSMFNNLAGSEQSGMYSVNGPPGTGKTTLLRDIIAPVLVKRAKELSRICDPGSAFRKVGEIEITETYSPWVYAPNESITNGGMVIASSNNGAVENISKELPLKKEVSEQYRSGISYFRTAAETVSGDENWGLISAVLGNKENRTNFVNSLWYDFKEGNKIGLQKSLDEEKLYDTIEWNKIRKKFENKLQEVATEKKRLEGFKSDYENFVTNKKMLTEISSKLEKAISEHKTAKEQFQDQDQKVALLSKEKTETLAELTIIKENKPPFFTYWLNKTKRESFKSAQENALNRYNTISEKLNNANPILSKYKEEFYNLEKLLVDLNSQKEKTAKLLDKLSVSTEEARSELKNNYADEQFWKTIESKKSQQSCPWYSDRLKTFQSELFVISLKLNEVFILTANAKSSRISTTLAGFFEYLKGNSEATKSEIKAMWDTFFLVVPVISSAFASVQTMFKDLDKEDIPWLFIDEAGQAVPQAAAASIWRSKRVGVVGDPFQIEPVVTIPNAITDNISQYFNLGKENVSSELSVQSMADRINPFGSYLTFNSKKEWIGIPLRVHRRCISPMFEIANSIAYDDTMYNSTASPKSININFKTNFIHCSGKISGRHFVQEQADLVKEILIKEIQSSKALPDVFVITPFSEVSYKLNSFLFKIIIAEIQKYRKSDSQEINAWLKTHVGTVHTFQGKQAEGVILCLGLDETKKGAATWASQKPNLLNVAITRAKYRFVAIGDEEIWLKQPFFNQLKQLNTSKTVESATV